jgi:glycerate kinase
LKKILIIPDKFKGSISSERICAIAQEKGKGHPLKIKTLPIADGGDGSIDVLQNVLHLQKITIFTYDALMRRIMAYYMLDSLNHIAYIELAKSAGLSIIDENDRNIMMTSTYGVGIMIADAMERNIQEVFLFIGGSATNDAALGCAHALGFKILDQHFDDLEGITKNIKKVYQIRKPKKELPKITIVSDVDNPMFGPLGAAHVYAGQKGATSKQILELDEGLTSLAKVYDKLQHHTSTTPGSGAAGAFGAGAMALFDAKIVNGFDFIADRLAVEEKIKEADIVITGEGSVDIQSFYGKVVGKIINLAQKHKKEVFIVCGKIEDDEKIEKIVNRDNIYTILEKSENILDAINNAEKYLEEVFNEIYNKIKNQFSNQE